MYDGESVTFNISLNHDINMYMWTLTLKEYLLSHALHSVDELASFRNSHLQLKDFCII
jgi:hypothetical protein